MTAVLIVGFSGIAGGAPEASPARGVPIHRVPSHGLAASIGDSLAAALVRLAPSVRMTAWKRDSVARDRPLVSAVADTLGDDLLLAVQDFHTQEVALRLVERSTWRAVLDAKAPSEDEEGEYRLLQRAVLGRARFPLRGAESGRVALLWFEEPGSGAPHTLWSTPIDTFPHRSSHSLHRLPISQAGWDDGSGLVVLRKDDEILVRTRSNWVGTSTFDAYFCGACAHLTMVSDWRVDAQNASLLRSQPLDDAAFAVARAFDGPHHYECWPSADLQVTPTVSAWLAHQQAVTLESALDLGGDDARVRLWGISADGLAKGSAPSYPETLGIVVRHTGSGAASRWSLQ